MECFEERGEALWLYVKARPGGQKDAFLALRARELVVTINAAPEKGKANQALIAFLAKKLKIAKSEIALIKGANARHKVLALPQSAQASLIDAIAKL
jgi:uncharacterized protein (TIGR00251 family)